MSTLFEDPLFIGDWYREKKLGSGGFGLVTLWKNKKTKESVAIKKCHSMEGRSTSEEKFRERWENEVRLMTETVKNDNIVSTVNIKPESFLQELQKTNPSGLKLLVMEYCESGDLRHLLNKSSNCSGIKETEVRAVLKSLRNAIFYLHDMKITHRDIKPENIVLKRVNNSTTVYKITDLGYARALDINSFKASLVGTIEYLAPELIHDQKYNNSVDYWSMGVIAYEIICGCRPFIPHAPVAQWLLQLKQKRSEHICITEDNNGQYIFSNRVFKENRVSRCFLSHMEKWLILALQWNPKQRGYVFEQQLPPPKPTTPNGGTRTVTFADSVPFNDTPPTRVLKLFTMIDDILNMKILTIFSLYTYEYLSFKIDESTQMSELYELIEEETGIEKSEIEIVLPIDQTIEKIDDTTKAIDLYLMNFYDKPMLYVMRRPVLSIQRKYLTILNDDVRPVIPQNIQMLLENDKIRLKTHILKHFINNCYYFIRHEKQLYDLFIEGVRNYVLGLNHEIAVFKGKIQGMQKMVYGVRGSSELYKVMLKNTKEVLSDKSFDNLGQTFAAWDEQESKFASNILKFCTATDKIVVRFESALRRSNDCVTNKLIDNPSIEDVFNIDRLEKLYDAIGYEISQKQDNEKTPIKMLTFVYECLKKRDTLLRDEALVTLQKSLINIKIEIEEIKKTTEKALAQGSKYTAEITTMTTDLVVSSHELSERMANVSKSSLLSNGFDLPDFRNILTISNRDSESNGRHSPDFRIGDPIHGGTMATGLDLKDDKLACYGEGTDWMSLVAAQDSIIDAFGDLVDDGLKSLPNILSRK